MPGEDDDLQLDLELGDDEEAEDGIENESGEDGGENAEGDERNDGFENEGHADEERQRAQVNRSGGRAANRLQTLRNENRQLAEQQARLQRELEEIRRSNAAPREDPALEQQRLALMTPEERMEYRFQQSEQRHQAQLRQIQRQTADATDRAAFNMLQATSPVAKRYAEKVEQLFQQEFGKGNFVDRSTILKYVIGEAMLAKGSGQVDKQRRQAEQRVSRQQTRPTNGRADVSTNRRGSQSLADKLSDVII